MKYILATAALSLCLGGYSQTREVLKIVYNDGITDYIPKDDISRISFEGSVDTQNPLYVSVNEIIQRLYKEPRSLIQHDFDFGYPSIMIGLDAQTEDFMSRDSPYNWFSYWYMYRTRGYSSEPAVMMWNTMYSCAAKATDIIDRKQSETDEDKLLTAQAYALRSWAYWNLTQTFAPNYAIDPQAKSIPVGVTWNNYFTGATLPAATVAEVYEYILDDISMAIDYLEGNKMVPSYINVAGAKRYIDLATAYGLRARYNLTMHRYAEAAADARLAIEKTSARPLDIAAAAYPGFNDVKLGNWMWGCDIESGDNLYNSVVNFTSHVCTLNIYGYIGLGVGKACGYALHDYLMTQQGDVRLNWFTDADGNNDNLTIAQQRVVKECHYISKIPYLNIKFDACMGKIIQPVGCADVPLMRVEEMYLIEAEGLAMSGKLSEGAAVLSDFVRTYRNPDYDFTPADAAALQTEIIWQRRIEFWGEGLALFDKLRLQLDVDRFVDPACDERYKVRIKGTSKWMLYRYPDVASIRVEGFDYTTPDETITLAGSEGLWNE